MRKIHRSRFTPRHHYSVPVVPFSDAEEAWFWYARCQRARIECARFGDQIALRGRPCDPDDIYRALMNLRRRGRVHQGHLRTLGKYGLLDRTPDPRCREEETEARLWDEALDRLLTPLREKGIVE